jgi:hypothetical protein
MSGGRCGNIMKSMSFRTLGRWTLASDPRQHHKSVVRYVNRLRGEACMNPGL